MLVLCRHLVKHCLNSQDLGTLCQTDRHADIISWHFIGRLIVWENAHKNVKPSSGGDNGFCSSDQTVVTNTNTNGIPVKVEMGHASFL